MNENTALLLSRVGKSIMSTAVVIRRISVVPLDKFIYLAAFMATHDIVVRAAHVVIIVVIRVVGGIVAVVTTQGNHNTQRSIIGDTPSGSATSQLELQTKGGDHTHITMHITTISSSKINME